MKSLFLIAILVTRPVHSNATIGKIHKNCLKTCANPTLSMSKIFDIAEYLKTCKPDNKQLVKRKLCKIKGIKK